MPDKPITVITYAASASLAAIALVYFFNPNYLIDSGTASTSVSARRKNVVGLQNPLNDCFINSVLQALAGLGDLRLYLIRELHRRKLSDPQIYKTLPEQKEDEKPLNSRKILSLQGGEVTQALKLILDQLNERPLKQKTISARNFILALERAFDTRLSKDQQDAQELLQVVAERVCDEYHAGSDARRRAHKSLSRKNSYAQESMGGLSLSIRTQNSQLSPPIAELGENKTEEEGLNAIEEAGFPLEGHTQSQIECQHCHFIPKSKPVSFVMLTLSVPQISSTTLNHCFDTYFKKETIDDYKCDRCRLVHAISVFQKDLLKEAFESARLNIQTKIDRIRAAIEEDPETPPKDIKLPDSRFAPTRQIERHVKMTSFPRILVIHLSRSIFDPNSSSAKNLAKVSFPEHLSLGGLIDRRTYKLLGMISHKGAHNSGHYECFRRQHVYAPYSTPHVDPESGPYSHLHTPNHSVIQSPKIPAVEAPTPTPTATQLDSVRTRSPTRNMPSSGGDSAEPASATSSRTSLVTDPNQSPPSTRPSSASLNAQPFSKRGSASTLQTSAATGDKAPTAEGRRDSSATTASRARSLVDRTKLGRGKKKKSSDRWWRISDDKVKECKTSEVLGMEREVYLLFYELERPSMETSNESH
ncbi:MAG: hypothetical protein LQ340_002397 [Diploschistes diacapsis]|nr:MAG: hypothetical protein LQ340_002397 [Diploschistes diacapsis]